MRVHGCGSVFTYLFLYMYMCAMTSPTGWLIPNLWKHRLPLFLIQSSKSSSVHVWFIHDFIYCKILGCRGKRWIKQEIYTGFHGSFALLQVFHWLINCAFTNFICIIILSIFDLKYLFCHYERTHSLHQLLLSWSSYFRFHPLSLIISILIYIVTHHFLTFDFYFEQRRWRGKYSGSNQFWRRLKIYSRRSSTYVHAYIHLC